MKKILIGVVVALTLFVTGWASNAEAGNGISEYTILVNGQHTGFPFVENADGSFSPLLPFMTGGRTFVPVRGVFETLGFEVGWNAATQEVSFERETDTIVITIGANTFLHNGNEIALDAPARVVNGNTFVPLRAPIEAIGGSISLESIPVTDFDWVNPAWYDFDMVHFITIYTHAFRFDRDTTHISLQMQINPDRSVTSGEFDEVVRIPIVSTGVAGELPSIDGFVLSGTTGPPTFSEPLTMTVVDVTSEHVDVSFAGTLQSVPGTITMSVHHPSMVGFGNVWINVRQLD